MEKTKDKKPYGFDPEAGEYLRTRLNARFTTAQALRALGIGESKFLNDRKAGLVKQHKNSRNRRAWFTGMDLYQYWFHQMDDESMPMSELRTAIDRVNRITEKAEMECLKIATRQHEQLRRMGKLGRCRTSKNAHHEQAI